MPLRLATYLGLGASFISFLYILYALWIKFFTDRLMVGWASLDEVAFLVCRWCITQTVSVQRFVRDWVILPGMGARDRLLKPT